MFKPLHLQSIIHRQVKLKSWHEAYWKEEGKNRICDVGASARSSNAAAVLQGVAPAPVRPVCAGDTWLRRNFPLVPLCNGVCPVGGRRARGRGAGEGGRDREKRDGGSSRDVGTSRQSRRHLVPRADSFSAFGTRGAQDLLRGPCVFGNSEYLIWRKIKLFPYSSVTSDVCLTFSPFKKKILLIIDGLLLDMSSKVFTLRLNVRWSLGSSAFVWTAEAKGKCHLEGFLLPYLARWPVQIPNMSWWASSSCMILITSTTTVHS